MTMTEGFVNFTTNLENTNFIFSTNFAGDPSKDKYNDSRRKANILVPRSQVEDLRAKGVNVRETRPREFDDPNDYNPDYFVLAQVKYRKRDGSLVKYPPKVYLVVGNNAPVLLDEDSIGVLDTIRVKNVNAVLSPYVTDGAQGRRISMYVRVMYVEQDLSDDPYADLYRRANETNPDFDPEDAPF